MEREPKILHLTLKKKWFDLILSGKKTEEYREDKPYWRRRLSLYDMHDNFICHNDYNIVRFRNGYSPTSPVMDVECKTIIRDYGEPEFGAPEKDKCYIIMLGKILHTSNLTIN